MKTAAIRGARLLAPVLPAMASAPRADAADGVRRRIVRFKSLD